MKRNSCFSRPYVLTIYLVTITYLGDFYRILKSLRWKLQRACTCDQVCETNGASCGFLDWGG